MKKPVLKHRMLKTFSLAIGVLFIFLFLTFNLLMSFSIRREATRDLSATAAEIKEVVLSEFPRIEDGLDENDSLSRLYPRIRSLLRSSRLLSQQNFFLSNRSFGLLFPNLIEAEADRYLAQNLLEALKKASPSQNQAVSLKVSGNTYHVLYTPLSSGTFKDRGYMVLYTDMTSLYRFGGQINRLLLFSALLAVLTAGLVTFYHSSGLAREIQKLCRFARRMGKGDLDKLEGNFKEQELQELSDDMNLLAVRLSNHDKEQKIFFQNVSHELKTPLMSIQGYSEGIKYNIVPDKEKACDIILAECDRLSGMVNDLLYVSRLDAEDLSLKIENINLKDLLAECCGKLEGIFLRQEKKLFMDLPVPPVFAQGDREKLMRAVSNLLTNCLKHAEQTVTVSLKQKGSEACIKVKDDGEGIAEKDMPHLFKRFYKGDKGNTGLGLSIVKSIADAHGGRISCGNNAEGGAYFLLKLKSYSSS